MNQQASNLTPKERIDIHTALVEVTKRLDEINRQTGVLRFDITGDEVSNSPQAMPPSSLDGQVFQLFDILCGVENNIAQIACRLGVSLAPAQQPNALKPASVR